jgi:hypothetical protein
LLLVRFQLQLITVNITFPKRGARSQNFVKAPAPAKSFGSLRLQIQNTSSLPLYYKKKKKIDMFILNSTKTSVADPDPQGF